MRYDPLTDEQREIRDLVRTLARERVAPRAAEIDKKGEFPWDMVELFREHELFGLPFEEQYGGTGTGALMVLVAVEELSKVCATTGLIMAVQELGSLGIKLAGTDEQKERFLPRLASGEWLAAYALTEPGSGSDSAAMRTDARLDGDEYVVNGVKWHVTSFNLADYVFVQAVLDNGPFAGEHVLLVVDLPWPGVEVVRTPHYSHHIADEHPIVSFTDVRVPASHLVGHEGQGMTFTQDWFRFERLMVAARCVGAGQRLVDEMTAFAKDRIVDGRPLAEYQLVAGMLADSATELFAARAMLYEVARSIDAGADRKTLHGQASMAKLYCSEMAGRVADRAVQVFGGRGYMRENVAERMFRELRVERIWEGASEIQRLIVARQLTNRGPGALLGAE